MQIIQTQHSDDGRISLKVADYDVQVLLIPLETLDTVYLEVWDEAGLCSRDEIASDGSIEIAQHRLWEIWRADKIEFDPVD